MKMKSLFELPTRVVSAIQDKGVGYWLVYWYSYWYLTFKKWRKPQRFPPYDLLADGQPEKQGYFIPKEEQQLEHPKSRIEDKGCDSAYCFGINSKSECLSVRLSHLSGNVVGCSLFLHLDDGKSYCLPEEHVNQVRTDDEDTFGSSRFKMQCILPMRKWRIFFNGLLREIGNTDDETTPRYRHVRIAVLYAPSAGVFDFMDNMSKETFAEVMANNSSLWETKPEKVYENIQDSLNFYEQPGMLLGTVTIDDGQERELHLWGSRGHHFMGSLENEKDNGSSNLPWKLYSQLTNGALIQIGEKTIKSQSKFRFCYGYVMRQNGFIYPLDSIKVLHRSPEEILISCNAESYQYHITAKVEKKSFGGFRSDSPSEYIIRQVDIVTKGMDGKGLLYLGSEVQGRKQGFEHSLLSGIIHSKELCTSISNSANGFSGLSGGKGASLYHLFNMKQGYTVPKGVIVTTNGYQKFIHRNLDRMLEELEKTVPFLSTEDLSDRCKKTVKVISEANLPEDLSHSIVKNLEDVFGKTLNHIKFAVRSSATGEDAEQMSAAGQMDTFLGVRGTKEILDAVKKCWASQFAFVAVQYKRQYGQQLNCPMAVVIQEMVPCDVAGVAFSCDPLTGNPSFLSITANYGLGESVVSSASEPDTVVLKRSIDDELCFHSRQIGTKKIKITMDEKMGVKESELSDTDSKKCCISDEMALKIGKILVMLEKRFENPRDIEWGIMDESIFLLQCRPVTSIDTETDYEIRNLSTSYIRTEKEFLTKANIGEIMPGASSPLTLDMFVKLWNYYTAKDPNNWGGEPMPDCLYHPKRFTFANNHVFFPLSDSFFKFSETKGEEMSDHTRGLSISVFGRVLNEPELIPICKDRHSTHHSSGGFLELFGSTLKMMYLIVSGIFGEFQMKRAAKKIDSRQIVLKKNGSCSELLSVIADNWFLCYPAYVCHMDISFASSFWNHVILSILRKEAGEWSNEVFSDFAYLVSTISGVESADVPAAIQELSNVVSKSIDPEEFRSMNLEDAVQWLNTTPLEAGATFKQFLRKHGHRCLKEYDVYSKTWGTDHKPLIKIVQENVSKNKKDIATKKSLSYEEIFSNMNIKLGFFNRVLLKLTLPLCRRGVRHREMTKSLLILTFDQVRKMYDQLGNTLVAEGRLLNKDIMYFLDAPEIKKLIETRSPRLVSRAFRRWKCHPEQESLFFPEMIRGIPESINMEESLETEDGFTMTGVPVSRGVVRATARVVVKLEDAKNIQPGDVLITYSTDIGWSPYFPLLSGIVTELGGLISHGAVVAREYGLPCVVNLHGAIRSFKSGDYVLLNGNKGFLKKLKSA